jgi:anti-anti-sigma regulatory factor
MAAVHVNPSIDHHRHHSLRHKICHSKLSDMKISHLSILHLTNVNTSGNTALDVIVAFKSTRTTIVGLVMRLIDVMGSMWRRKMKKVALTFG